MNWQLVLSLLGSVGTVVLALLYANAAKGAAISDQVRAIAEHALASKIAADAVAAAKEEYIRELEKTIIGSLSPGQLAQRLNILFASQVSRAPSTVPIAVRPTSSTKP